MKQISVTERSNPKSKNIDLLNSDDITQVISDCEKEIFGGFENYDGIYSDEFVDACESIIRKMRKHIQNEGTLNLVLVGAGTSGRLCRVMAKMVEPLVREKIKVIPIIAGGIKALVRAEPNTEDKKEEGAKDFLAYTKNINRSKCFVVGASCGLSALYVLGALEEANKYSKGRTALIGFTSKKTAPLKIGSDIIVLNPIIGPEPIVGSVRMKGGTTTMLILYALIISIVSRVDETRKSIVQIFKEGESTLSLVHTYRKSISMLISKGGRALQSEGHIFLLGSDFYGTLCIYDAAECPPTFGAKINDVNGFTKKGVSDLEYFPYEKGEKMAKEIDMDYFIKVISPTISKNDLVLFVGNENDEVNSLKKDVVYDLKVGQRKSDKKVSEKNKETYIRENWKSDFQKVLFIRSLLIHVSTGSFVLSGKVYENKMIDLKITNKKLFYRAIRIIKDITQKDEKIIEKIMLDVIYEGMDFSRNILMDHISLSATKENVVPLTILSLIYPTKSLDVLRLMLKKEPAVRRLISSELSHL